MRRVWILSLALFLGCLPVSSNPPCPSPQASRCFNNRVELCSPDGEWLRVMDCSLVGPNWECLEIPEGHACLEVVR